MQQKEKRRLIALVMTCMVLLSLFGGTQVSAQKNTGKYISSEQFLKKLFTTTHITKNGQKTYIARAKQLKILNSGEINERTAAMTRAEAAVLLERTDEYLNKNPISKELIETILDQNRISDIGGTSPLRKELIASAYAKALILCDSKEDFSGSCEFHPNAFVLKEEADNLIARFMDPAKRIPCAANGMAVKQENRPVNADKFKAVYACVPNEFYEEPFRFEKHSAWGTSNFGFKENEHYTYPVNMNLDHLSQFIGNNELRRDYQELNDMFCSQTKKYLQTIMNVKYTDTFDTWEKDVKTCISDPESGSVKLAFCYAESQLRKYKASIETRYFYIDPDMVYMSMDGVYVRVYVQYRITTEDPALTEQLENEAGSLLLAKPGKLNHCKVGEWSDACFEVRLHRTPLEYSLEKEIGVDIEGGLVDFKKN